MFNYCPNCGIKIVNDKAKFCSSCGESFDMYLSNYNNNTNYHRQTVRNDFFSEPVKKLGIPVYCLVFGDDVEKLFLYNNEFYKDIDCRFKYGFTVKDYSQDPHAFDHYLRKNDPFHNDMHNIHDDPFHKDIHSNHNDPFHKDNHGMNGGNLHNDPFHNHR